MTFMKWLTIDFPSKLLANRNLHVILKQKLFKSELWVCYWMGVVKCFYDLCILQNRRNHWTNWASSLLPFRTIKSTVLCRTDYMYTIAEMRAVDGSSKQCVMIMYRSCIKKLNLVQPARISVVFESKRNSTVVPHLSNNLVVGPFSWNI